MPRYRIEIIKEIQKLTRLIQQSNNYRQIRFLRLHRAWLQQNLEKLIS